MFSAATALGAGGGKFVLIAAAIGQLNQLARDVVATQCRGRRRSRPAVT